MEVVSCRMAGEVYMPKRNPRTPSDGDPSQDPDRSGPPDAAAPADSETIATDELPLDLEADFVPLAADEDGRQPERWEIDPFQYDSLQAQEAFDAAVAAAAAGDGEEAVQ